VRTEHRLRQQIVCVSRRIWERGWVANHDGNATARAAPGRIVATATALSKREIDSEKLIVVDESRRVVSGRLRPFSELGLHLVVYAGRPDVGAVLHAHPPHATARALLGLPLPCFLPEAVVSLGLEIPLVPPAAPGAEAERALSPFVEANDAALLGGHGVLSWGDDPEQCYLRMELVEHLSRIADLVEARGPLPSLPPELLRKLLESRARAGLGSEGRRGRARV